MSANHVDPHDFDAVTRALESQSAEAAQRAPIVAGPMVEAVLRELVEHMRAVADGAERRVLTLRGLPLSPDDYAALRDALGSGEARVEVSIGGLVEAQETVFSGVWWVKNANLEGTVLAEEIEIAPAPIILAADPEDIRASAEALAQRLAARDARPS